MNSLQELFLLTRGKGRYALLRVDADQWVRWRNSRIGLLNGYPRLRVGGPKRLLHSMILGVKEFLPGWEVDHRNGDKLDARRCNLQIVPHHVNNGRARGPDGRGWPGGAPRYGGRWQARIRIQRSSISRRCDTQEQARALVAWWKRVLYGEAYDAEAAHAPAATGAAAAPASWREETPKETENEEQTPENAKNGQKAAKSAKNEQKAAAGGESAPKTAQKGAQDSPLAARLARPDGVAGTALGGADDDGEGIRA